MEREIWSLRERLLVKELRFGEKTWPGREWDLPHKEELRITIDSDDGSVSRIRKSKWEIKARTVVNKVFVRQIYLSILI